MQKKDITVRFKNGISERPAAMLVQAASQFESRIFIEVGRQKMNAKSIMGMMALGLENGDVVTITCEGNDEKEALSRMEAYLTSREPE